MVEIIHILVAGIFPIAQRTNSSYFQNESIRFFSKQDVIFVYRAEKETSIQKKSNLEQKAKYTLK